MKQLLFYTGAYIDGSALRGDTLPPVITYYDISYMVFVSNGFTQGSGFAVKVDFFGK